MKLRIEQDTDPWNPREDFDCHLGTMVCWHRRYNLGDEQPKYPAGEFKWRLMQETHPDIPEDISIEHIDRFISKRYFMLPLYLYDHGGITMSTDRFSCPWDSGQAGWIYASWAKLNENGIETYEDAAKALEQEVETYDKYLTGDVWGYIIENDDGDDIGSCWGFYGEEYCRQEGEAQLAYFEKKAVEDAELEPVLSYVDGM